MRGGHHRFQHSAALTYSTVRIARVEWNSCRMYAQGSCGP